MLGFLGLMLAGQGASADANAPTLDLKQNDAAGEAAAALALVEAFNLRLLGSRTATSTLEKWCSDRKLADVPKIRAKIITGVEKPPTPEQRKRLRISESEPVSYRRVELECGDHVLSEADNWFVPARLTEDMRNRLERTDAPFGRVVEALSPVRKTFKVEFLWSPQPQNPGAAEGRREEFNSIPERVLRHSALVFAGNGDPFAEVHETYTSSILRFGPR
jgi:chorismate-pyruvate lyase